MPLRVRSLFCLFSGSGDPYTRGLFHRIGLPFASVLLIAAAAVAGPALSAQIPDRILQAVDSSRSQALPNHHPLWANEANSGGLAPASLSLNQLTLVLSRSPQQEAAFHQFLADQQNPASPEYHHWLTPAEVGERFGLSDQDIATITSWLESQGLQVNWVSPSRTFIGFGGAATNVGRAFQTAMEYYNVNGAHRISVNSDPMVPAALSPAIKAVRGLYTIDERPNHRISAVESATPQMNSSSGKNYIAPNDFDTIYNVPSSLTGAGITIGIIGWSRTNPADFDNFKSKTGVTFADPTEVIPTAYGGIDPGPALTSPSSGNNSALGNQAEATLDVLRAGSVAPAATLLLVVSSQAGALDGLGADMQYLVNTSPVPAQVITISFGACESSAGAGGVAFWDSLFQTAAAEGISVFVSSGDSGAAGCDNAFSTPPVTPAAISPNYICSSAFATCVGGTQFADTASPSTYWSPTNGTGYLSALGYIPEGAWNESTATSVAATGGGVSAFVPTPSWQTGLGVPSPGTGRYTPDVSFSGSSHDGYFACMAAASGSCVTTGGSFGFISFSGTSAAAPGMAGVAALLDQKLGAPQGNLNPGIYFEAASAPTAFHDVTVASSGVSGCSVNTASICNNTIPAAAGGTFQAGFQVGPGYDEATGLGSLNVGNFLQSFSNLKTPTVTVTPSVSSVTTTQAFNVTVTVIGGAGNPVPTGSVTINIGSYASSPTTLSNGSAIIAVSGSSITAGNHSILAAYTPDNSSSSTYSSASGSNSITVTAVLAPTTTTTAASQITSSTATLGGTINPNGADTKYWFHYGTSSTLSGATQTSVVDLGSGFLANPVVGAVSGLKVSTTYYFRLVAQNSVGTTNGSILSFPTTAPPPPSFTVSGTPVTVAAGATTGNTSTISVTPTNGFTGSVALTAQVTGPTGAQNLPTLSFGTTSPVSITSTSAGMATLTVSTLASQTSCVAVNQMPRGIRWYRRGGAVLAFLLLFGIAPSRRKWRAMIAMLLLFVAIGSLLACSGSTKSTACNNIVTPGTTSGSYTITVTGTGTGPTSSTQTISTIALTVQ